VVDGHTVRTSAGSLLPGSLHPTGDLLIPVGKAADPVPAAVASPSGTAPADHVPAALAAPALSAGAAATQQHEAVVLEFLRSTREVVAAQKEVMLGLLGTSGLPEGRRIMDVGVEPPPTLPAPAPVAEGIVEQLARLKTIGAIVAWVVEHVSTSAEAAPPVAATASRPTSTAVPAAPAVAREPATDGGTHRYVVEPAPAPGPTVPAD